MKRALYLALFLATFSLGLGGFLLPTAFAAATSTPATGGSAISADTNTTNGTATWTTLTGPTITEGANREFPASGTFILNAPSGFVFSTTTTVTATVSLSAGAGTCFSFSASTVNPSTTTITFTLNARDSNPAPSGSTKCQVAFSNIQVRPTSGTPLASGNITKSGTAAISGITAGTTNLGSLTEVAGAVSASKSTMSASPASVSTDGGAQTTVTVSAYDQFNNPKASQAVTLSSTGTGNTFIQPSSLTATTTGTMSSTKAESKTISAVVGGTAITQTASVNFTVGVFDHITVTPSGAQSVAGGSTLSFSAQGFDINNNAVTGLTYTWAVVPGTGTGSVTSGGVLTGGRAGNLTVTATSGAKTGTSGTVTVTNVAPVVNNQSVSTNEDTSLPITLTGTDANGDTVTYSIVANPLHGTLTGLNASTGAVTYNPTANYNGSDSFTFRSNDGTANSNTGTISLTVNPVNDSPVLTAIGNKSTNENQLLSFVISGTDVDGDALTYSATNLPSGSSFNAGNQTFSWTPSYSQAGTFNNIHFSVTDGSLSASEDITITVNNVNRAPSLTAIGNKTANENSLLQFTISGTDPDGDALTYSATNLPTGASFDAGNQTFSWVINYSDSGTYNLVHFSVTDGSLSANEDITVTVNNVNRAPTLTFIGNKSVNENSDLTFIVSANDPDGDALTYSATNLPSGASFNVVTQTFSWTPSYSQAGTFNNIHFSATDGTASASEDITVTVNNVNRAPVLTAIGNKSTNENQLLSFVISGTDADGDSLTYSASNLPSGASFNTGTQTFSWTPSYSQAGTFNNVHFEITDGTLSAIEDITMTVNNVNRTPILTFIGNQSVAENSELTFTISATDPDGDALTYSATNLPSGASFDANTATLTWTPSYSQSGTYTLIHFSVTDGTLSASEDITLTVSNTNRAPILTAIGNKSVNENQALSFTISASDPDGDALTYSATNLPSGASFNAGTQTLSWTPTYNQAGTYNLIHFDVTDGTLSVSEDISIVVSNVNRAPILDSIGNKTGSENSEPTFAVSATDPDGDVLTYSATNLPSGASFNTGTQTFSWTPTYDQAGTYTLVHFSVTDGSLSAAEDITITVSNTNRAPILTAIGNKTGAENSELTFTISATDPDGDAVAYFATNLPAGAVFATSTQTFSWTPTYSQAGSYTLIHFSTTDGSLSASEDITITVNNVNRAPALTAIGNKSTNENQALSFIISASDADADALTYSATNLPSGASFNTGTQTFSWTPSYSQAGTYNLVHFDVTDGTATTSEDITITVNNVNRAPTLTAIGNKTADENSLLQFTISGTDPDGDSLTYSATNLPSGATFDAGTQTFSWVINYNNAGTYNLVHFAVTDGTATTSEDITITVNNVNRAPTLTFIGNQSAAENSNLTFVVSATDPDGDALTYSATNLPIGASFNAGTQTFSWTPSYSQAGTYTLIHFSATDGSLSANEDITITVSNTNRAPVLTAIGNKSGAENSELSFTISATDPDVDALTYSATNLPAGAVFATSTQTFSWTPDYNQAGTFNNVHFSVTDGSLSASEDITITVSNTNRAPSLTAIGNKSANENQLLSFTISGSDPDGDALTYSATNLPSGATISTSTGAFNWTPTYEQSGTYNLVHFSVTDGTLSSSEDISIVVSNVNRAPILTAIGNKTGSENSELTFVVSATDPDGDSLTYSATNTPSGSAFNTGTQTFSWTPDYGQAGTYSLVNFAVTDGSLSASEDITATISHTNRAPILTAIGNKTGSENSALSFTISGSDPDGDTVTYSATNLPSGASFDANTATFSWTPDYNQSGTYNNIHFSATDGSLSASEDITITVSNTNRGPALTAIGNKTGAENSSLQFTVSGTDPDSDTLTYSATNLPSGATISTSTGAFNWTPDYNQAGTFNNVHFSATDGSLSSSEDITITVSNTNRAPVITAIGNKSGAENSELTFIISATDPDGDAVTYSATNLPAGAVFATSTQTFTWTPDFNQAGTYNLVHFSATDGSLSASEDITITVSNTNRGPALTAIGNKSTNENQALSFTISGTDPDGDVLTYSATNLPSGASFNAGTQTFSWTPSYSQAGTYNLVHFSVTDGTLSTSEDITVTVNNVNRAPILDATSNKTGSENSVLSFTISATDPDGDAVTYSAPSLPSGASFDANTATFSWTPDFNQNGNYSATFTVSDGLLSDSQNVAIDIGNVNRTPNLTAIGNKNIAENSALNFTISATDPDGDALTYSASNLPSGASFDANTATFSWTPAYSQAGTYTLVHFSVTDGSLSASEDITITVSNTNRAPSLTAIGNKSANENQLLSFTISGSDPDGDALTYSATNLPSGASFNAGTQTFSWTPSYSQAGTYNLVHFSVTDGTLSTSEDITITVNNVNRAPVLTAIGNKTGAENSELTFVVSASDADNDTLTYTATNLPAGASVNSGTGSFSWTPTYDQSGTFNNVIFEVSDGSATTTENITIVIDNVNRSPILTAIGNKTGAENSELSFTIYATDPDGDAITYSATNTPSGAVFNTGTQTFSWTPSYSQAGTYTLIHFSATDGSLSASEDITIIVSNTNRGPELTAIGNKAADENSLLQFTVSATDPDGDALTYSASNLPSGASFDANTATFSWTPDYTQAGTYNLIHFSVTDGIASTSEDITATINNVNRAPILDSIGSKTGSENSALNFTIFGTDPDGDTLTYSATNLPTGANFSTTTRAFNWTPDYNQAGTYNNVHFEVTDGTVSDSEDLTVTVSDTDRAPILIPIGNKSATENSELTFIVSATDSDGDALTYSATNLPSGATFNSTTRTFAWTPDYTQSGAYNNIHFSVTDGNLSASEDITVTVSNTNRSPSLTAIGDKTIDENKTLSFTISGTDPDGDTLTYSTTNLPNGATFNAPTGTFTWRPGFSQSGNYPAIHFEVSDGRVVSGEDIVITVKDVSQDSGGIISGGGSGNLALYNFGPSVIAPAAVISAPSAPITQPTSQGELNNSGPLTAGEQNIITEKPATSEIIAPSSEQVPAETAINEAPKEKTSLLANLADLISARNLKTMVLSVAQRISQSINYLLSIFGMIFSTN